MPQATALGAKMCRGTFFIPENVCEKVWRRLARVYRGKIAAYCAVIAAVLDRDYADRLSEFAIRQSEFDAWAVDARNYNFHLPC